MNLFKKVVNAVKGTAKAVGKVEKNVAKAVVKGAVDTGHAVGAVATNKYVQGALAVGLAATGVGLPAAAAIGAGVKGGGNLLKKGGNLKSAATGAAQGAALGAGAAVAGSAVRAVKDKTGLGGFRNTLLKGKEGQAESIVARDKKAQGQSHYSPHPLPVTQRPTLKPRNHTPEEMSGAPRNTDPVIMAEQSGVKLPPKSPGLAPVIEAITKPKKERAKTPSSTMSAIGELKDQITTLAQSANSASSLPVGGGDSAPADTSGKKNNTILLAVAAGVALLVVMMNKKG